MIENVADGMQNALTEVAMPMLAVVALGAVVITALNKGYSGWQVAETTISVLCLVSLAGLAVYGESIPAAIIGLITATVAMKRFSGFRRGGRVITH